VEAITTIKTLKKIKGDSIMEIKKLKIKGEIYVIYPVYHYFEMTNEPNYNAYIQNANEISKFRTFKNINDVVEYCKKYMNATEI
jgi:hypothetical protein